MPAVGLSLCAGVALDTLLGEPRRTHPLVLFGRLADRLEHWLNRQPQQPAARLDGLLAWSLAVLPPTLLAALLSQLPGLGGLCDILFLYAALGLRSLGDHLLPVHQALQQQDLPAARQRVSYLVSRETAGLDAQGVARAATESALENGADAVFASLFWFALAGAPGVVLHRLANTLDAMWGYRTHRFARFGWTAARMDDLLNYLPARLTALTYALLGHTRSALACWCRQAPRWDSPNAGPVMAAGAGAIQVRLGGPARYHGQRHQRPRLGLGASAGAGDICRALQLVRRGVLLWLLLALSGDLLWP